MSKQRKQFIFNDLAQTSLAKLQKAAHYVANLMFSIVCMRQHRVAHSGAVGAHLTVLSGRMNRILLPL
jgi:hypothetical protein